MSTNQSSVNLTLLLEWLRPFAFGVVAGVVLVLLILFLIPGSPTPKAAPKEELAQIQPATPVEIEERPLPQLSPKLPKNWSELRPVSPPPKKVPAEPVEEIIEDKPFVPNPPYQRPVRPSDWVDESLNPNAE